MAKKPAGETVEQKAKETEAPPEEKRERKPGELFEGEVHIACRALGCTSKIAKVAGGVGEDRGPNRLYICVECGTAMPMNVGGNFSNM
jgi:hypothetical protein